MPDATTSKPTAAFILALLGGLWMILAGAFWGPGWGMGGMHRGGMPHHGPPDHAPTSWMHQRGVVCSFTADYTWWPWVGLAAGVLIVIGAGMLYARPEQRVGWGIAILVAAVVSLFLGAGGLIGALLAIIGGILALTSRAPTEPSRPAEPPE